MNSEKPLMNIKKVSLFLNVSHLTVRRAIVKGQMEAYKMGRDYRFSQDQLDAYLLKRKVSFKKQKMSI